MKYKDKQTGGLYVLYKDTKVNISALSNVEAGATAFATDTGEMGVYSGTAWVWGNLINDKLARINYNAVYGITEDFTSTTPTGWSWAGSPFVTPSTLQIINSTWLRMGGTSGGARSFFYKTSIANMAYFAVIPALDATSDGMYVGIRFDNGTDDTYSEVVLRYSSSGTPFRVYYVSRIGGGTVTETEVTNLAQPLFDGWLIFGVSGTRWTNWTPQAILGSRNGTWLRQNANGPNMTFTPMRVGIVVKFGSGTWEDAGIDAVNF